MPLTGKPVPRLPLEPINEGLLAAFMPSLFKGTGLERRKEVRYPTYDPAQVRLSPGGRCISGTILDISRSGLGIELGAFIRRGSRVEIILAGRAVIFGTVRYCRRVAKGHHAGVLIEHVVGVRPQLPVLANTLADSLL
jgi:hypothetical protein